MPDPTGTYFLVRCGEELNEAAPYLLIAARLALRHLKGRHDPLAVEATEAILLLEQAVAMATREGKKDDLG